MIRKPSLPYNFRMIEKADEPFEELFKDEWDAEIARRIEELDSGKVKTIPWEEVRRLIAEKLTR